MAPVRSVRGVVVAWPVIVTRVAFVKQPVAMADNGLPVGPAKRKW